MFADNRTVPDQGRSEPPGTPDAGRPIDPDWAWAPYKPDTQRPWDLRRAGHLFRRAAFGADWGQLQQALADGPQRTVDRLLRPDADVEAFHRTYDEYEASTAGSDSADGLRAWWLRRMMQTPHPLLEKMTLFWHDHFAISNARVKNALLMHKHVQSLRSHALGRFAPLLQSVSRDPAVLLGLEAAANRKAQPNEQPARTIVEVYSLGPGHATEEDLRSAARAFTGWFVLRGQLRYIEREHDTGTKRFLGEEGDFDADAVVRILLGQPAVSRLLVRKLYRWLICETEESDDALLAPLVESFRKDYDVATLVETMLRSNLFFSPAAYRQRIKSPVEFALGIVRGLEGMVSTTQLGQDLAALGENLYHPPTVRGWRGGQYWINRATLIGRSNLAGALLSGSEPYGDKLDPAAIAKKHGFPDPEPAGRFLLDLFLQGDVEADVGDRLLRDVAAAGGDLSRRLRRLAGTIVTLPEFHLA
ncbi:MAG TPA: DUF1800 domain-containing protein [Thermoguttaceae bacterium]|nr:DUF1800 domain-containing protein [Thermoguttaceae bacterium]